MWVVRGTWTVPTPGLFTGTHQDPLKVIKAETADDAIREAVRGCNVLQLEHGVSFSVFPVGGGFADTYEAKYDHPPMTDNHASTGAKLKIRKFTQHEMELEL
jgi:diaminopimelate decarboxylase